MKGLGDIDFQGDNCLSRIDSTEVKFLVSHHTH